MVRHNKSVEYINDLLYNPITKLVKKMNDEIIKILEEGCKKGFVEMWSRSA